MEDATEESNISGPSRRSVSITIPSISICVLKANCFMAGLLYFGWDFDATASPGHIANILNTDSSLRS